MAPLLASNASKGAMRTTGRTHSDLVAELSFPFAPRNTEAVGTDAYLFLAGGGAGLGADLPVEIQYGRTLRIPGMYHRIPPEIPPPVVLHIPAYGRIVRIPGVIIRRIDLDAV